MEKGKEKREGAAPRKMMYALFPFPFSFFPIDPSLRGARCNS